jgi:RNA polymerase sigma-70 factor (ECF subfamily)
MSATRIGTGEVDELAETPQQTFERLLRPHLRRLYRLAFRLTGNAADAEDLMQDVLIRLFERADELSSIADLRPWTSRVLYNRFVDHRRRAKRRRFEVVESSADLAEGGIHQLPSPAYGPDVDAAIALDLQRLEGVLAAMSEDHRVLVLLHDAEGCTLEEIAAMTAIPIGTVKSRLHRARERLRQLWDDGTIRA